MSNFKCQINYKFLAKLILGFFILGLIFFSFGLKEVYANWVKMNNNTGADNVSNDSGTNLLDNGGAKIKLSTSNNPYIVWNGNDGSSTYDNFFSKWTPSACSGNGCWTKMDGTPGYENISNSGTAYTPQMLVYNNNPYVAYLDNSTGIYQIYMTKWTPGGCGGSGCWTKMDGTAGVDQVTTDVYEIQADWIMQISSTGNPYFTFLENNPDWQNGEIDFTKWTVGTGWTKMDGTSGYDTLSVNSSYRQDMKLDSSNNPYIVWASTNLGDQNLYFTKWTPGAGSGVCGGPTDCWTDASGTTAGPETFNYVPCDHPHLQLDAASKPYIIFQGHPPGGSNAQLLFRKWTGSSWTGMDGISDYDNIGNSDPYAALAEGAKILVDSSNNPFIIFFHYNSSYGIPDDVYFSKWTPGAGAGVCGGPTDCWTNMAGTIAGYENISNSAVRVSNQELIFSSANNPFISWEENSDIYLRKWTASVGWTKMDGTTVSNENVSNSTTAHGQDFQLNSDNLPFMAFTDYKDLSKGGFGDIYFTKWGTFGLAPLTGQVTLTADVEPSLTLTLTSTACNLGSFDSANLKTCSYGAEVSTNGSAGYTALIKSDGDLRNATNSITNVSGGSIIAATESYGLATTQSSQTISQINDANSDTFYTQADCTALNNQGSTAMTASALSTSDQTFASSGEPIASDTTYLCHAVAITGATPAGVYAQLVTITVIGNF